jgi:hypothetical protein
MVFPRKRQMGSPDKPRLEIIDSPPSAEAQAVFIQWTIYNVDSWN